MEIKEYQKMQDKLALQRIIAISEKEISEGKTIPIDQAFEDLNKKIEKLKNKSNN